MLLITLKKKTLLLKKTKGYINIRDITETYRKIMYTNKPTGPNTPKRKTEKQAKLKVDTKINRANRDSKYETICSIIIVFRYKPTSNSVINNFHQFIIGI